MRRNFGVSTSVYHPWVALWAFFVVGLCAPSVLGAASTSLYDDTVILRDIFAALSGPTLWPTIWKEHWSDATVKPEAVSTCDLYRDWHGATCSGDKRIVRLEHRSGLATGALPSSVVDLSRLRYFDLADNRISGTVPAFAARGTPDLEGIVLGGNRLSGPIPASLGELRRLRFLALGHNKLTGPIPDALGSCVLLEALLLHLNALTGPIPESLYKLKNLRHLRLDGNQLQGRVDGPRLMDAMPHLVALELAGNAQIELAWDPRLSSLHLLTLPSDPIGTAATDGRALPGELRTSAPLPRSTPGGGNGNARVHVPRGDSTAPHRFLAMGDFGTGGQMMGAARELATAQHFVATARWIDAAYTVTVGDNLYVVPWIPQEVFFQESFERLYSDAPLDRPWYAAIGNHDSRSQFGYAERNAKWKMRYGEYAALDPSVPSRRCAGSSLPAQSLLDIFIHDTLGSGAYAFKGRHYRQLVQELSNSTAAFKMVVGHYPPLSSGCHKGLRGGAAAGVAIQYSGAGNVIFSGHDHHSEALFDPSQNVFHFLVGSFARGPCVINASPRSLFVEKMLGGFAYVTVDAMLLNVTFVSEIGHMQAKIVVPHDWRLRKLNRTPTADEITEYVRQRDASVCSLSTSTTRVKGSPPTKSGTAHGGGSSRGNPAKTQPPSAATSTPQATIAATTLAPQEIAEGGVQVVRGGAKADGAAKWATASTAPIRRRATRGATPFGASTRFFMLHGPPAEGGMETALWWATAVVCAAVPLLLTYMTVSGTFESASARRRHAMVASDEPQDSTA